jgi:hypothetical protein
VDRRFFAAFKTVSVPYAVTRFALSVFDNHFVQRLPTRSSPRRAFDQGLGRADCLAGRVMANERIHEIGRDRIDQAGHYFNAPTSKVVTALGARQRYALTRPAALVE